MAVAQEISKPRLYLFPLPSVQQHGPAAAAPAATPAPAPITPGSQPLTDSEKVHYLLRRSFGPYSLVRTGFAAAINQATGTPEEWGGGWAGYGRRYGSKFGQNAIRGSLQTGTQIWLHEDPRYFRSNLSGFWPRSMYAIKHTFLTYRDNGTTKIDDARLAGDFGGGLISRVWHPDSDNSISDGLVSGATAYGYDFAISWLKEFWPDISARLPKFFRSFTP